MAEPGNPNRYPGYRRVDIPSLDREKAVLREKVVGQEEAVAAFASLAVKIKSGVRSVRPSPIDTKFLLGPSGVGKTELVYALAELLAEGDPKARDKVIKINGGDYQDAQRHGISRLFGVPPGFVGAERPEEPGSGAKAIFSPQNLAAHKIPYIDRSGRQKSVNLILIDEAEKAGRLFHIAFLPILDKGEADLANNTKADFRDAVFLYTSNIGNTLAEQQHSQRPSRTDIPSAFQETVEDVIFRDEERNTLIREFTQAFPPEFRGRIQEPIVFNHLSHEVVNIIAQMKIKEVEAAFAASGIRIELDVPAEVREWLNKNGYDRSEGARGMDKLIKGQIMEKLLAFDAARDVDVLATGIDRKRIGVSVSDDGTYLEFYFAEGYQLPDPSQRSEATVIVAPTQSQVGKPKEIIIQISDNDEDKRASNPPSVPTQPPSKETRQVQEFDRARLIAEEHKKWQEVLGVPVEVKPIPDYITPEIREALLREGLELRYIPALDLGTPEDLARNPNYAEYLQRRYPNWRYYEGMDISERLNISIPRNLNNWFWGQVKQGNIDFPNLPGQWVAVETRRKRQDGETYRSSHTLAWELRTLKTDDHGRIFWGILNAAINKTKGTFISQLGLSDYNVDLTLLDPVSWNLLANREGWGKTYNNEWTSAEIRDLGRPRLVVVGEAGRGGAAYALGSETSSEIAGFSHEFRAALLLPELKVGSQEPTTRDRQYWDNLFKSPDILRGEQFYKTQEIAKIERAKEILGKDFLGVEAVRRMQNVIKWSGENLPTVTFVLDDLPPFPFTEEDLQAAKALGEMLVVRPREVVTMGRRGPLTFEQFRGFFPNIISDYRTRINEMGFGWSLVSKNILQGSADKSWSEQEALLRQYEEELKRRDAKNTSVQRRTTLEAVYDELLYFTNNSEWLLAQYYDTVRDDRSQIVYGSTDQYRTTVHRSDMLGVEARYAQVHSGSHYGVCAQR